MKNLYLVRFLNVLFVIASFSSACYAQQTPVVCMPFNGNALDVSGNNHHGNVIGASLTFDRFGNPNAAFDFDGVDDCIQLTDSIGSYFPTNELTIVFWAKADSMWNNSPFLLLPNDNSDRLNVHIYYDNNGTPSTFWDYGNISQGGRLYIPNVPFQSVWQHYAFVVSESLDSMRVYRDGVLQAGKANISGLFDRSRMMNIGGGISDVTNCHFNGKIDDVQLFNTALSAGDVWNNYINSNSCLNNLQSYLKGKVFFDLNSNLTQDAGELPYANSQILELNTGRPCFSFPNGQYIFGIDSNGTFEVTPTNFVMYYNATPVTHTATFTSIGEIDSLNDFALQPSGTFNDLRIVLSPLTPFRPGFSSSYNLFYENVGTTTLGGEVILFLDSLLSFDSASETPFSVTTDSVVWNISPLQPFESGNIVVTCILQIGTPNGTQLNSMAMIAPVTGDAAPGNNYSSWEVVSTGSYDPNDITVSRTAIDISEVANPPILNYLIRFQNTGTDTAFTVIVENQLPVELSNSTFELLNTSHNCSVEYNPVTRLFKFYFNNILLPDSNINEPGSHGFILYQVKPEANLTLGTQIISNAGIYFDFNAPVITNDAITTITDFTGLDESGAETTIQLFPNPANDFIFILPGKADLTSNLVELTDVHGKTLSVHKIAMASGTIHRLNISSLHQGLYFIRYSTPNHVRIQKFIKQ